MAIFKVGYPNPVTAGNTLTYTLAVVNHGPSDAQDVKVSDSLPPEVTYQSLTSTAGTTCSEASGTISCDLGTLVVGGTATIAIVTTAHPGLPPNSFTNTAVVSSATPDPDPSNNSADFISNLLFSADMVLTKTASPKPVIAGNDLTYTLEATNNGSSLAHGVTVSDPLPAATTFVSADVMSGAWQLHGVPEGTTGTVSCSLGDVQMGTTVTIVITVKVGAGVTPFTAIRNTATVDSTTPDPAPSNNTATDRTDVLSEADLVLTKTATPDTVHAGDNVTYTIDGLQRWPFQRRGGDRGRPAPITGELRLGHTQPGDVCPHGAAPSYAVWVPWRPGIQRRSPSWPR